MDQPRRIQHAEILLEALPYIRRFAGKTIVVKYGGNAMIDDDLKQAFARDMVLLKYVGMQPVVVHGGGPQINQMLDTLAIPSSFVRGQRVTDAPTMRVVEMILAGEINGEIVSRIDVAGGRAAGISGKDGGLIRARQRSSELGRVGEVVAVDPDVIRALQARDFIPVIAPVGSSPEGESLNINADTVAGKVAEALQAEKLLLLTDVEGIKDARGKLIPSLSSSQALKLIESGVVDGGMIPKVECCLEALRGGVQKVHIIDGRVRHAPLLELFTDEGVGTEVHRDGSGARPQKRKDKAA
ncbi:MAG: acetylglutamate kinase [Deltaproteobacteria bacterium]|nr:acetylglutamate kinase [Deltaproteobacteria bacterium]